jgi:hypothetical protein
MAVIKKVQLDTNEISFDPSSWSTKPFLYVVYMHHKRFTEEEFKEITDWCEKNIIEQVWIRRHIFAGFRFLFVNPSDASLFKLRWS